MDLFDKDMQELVARGKSQGYLTYDEVNDYLPDEEINPRTRITAYRIFREKMRLNVPMASPTAPFAREPGAVLSSRIRGKSILSEYT